MSNTLSTRISDKFNNFEFALKFSLSFLITGLFFILISFFYIPGGNTNILRFLLGSFSLAIWFILTPLLDSRKRDNIMIELAKLLVNSIISLCLIYYFVCTIYGSKISHLWDIVAIIPTIYLVYYIIDSLFSIIKVFMILFKKVFDILFDNPSTDSPLKLFFQNISAILISLSGVLATIVAVITSVKTIVQSFI